MLERMKSEEALTLMPERVHCLAPDAFIYIMHSASKLKSGFFKLLDRTSL